MALLEKISDLRGKEVITADGKSVGRLTDLAIDERSWAVKALIVDVESSLASLFGVKKKLLKSPRVRITSDKVEHIGDVVKLREDLQHLKVELHGA